MAVRGCEVSAPRPTTLRVDPKLIQSVDAMARELGMKRAEMLRYCLRLGLAQVVRDHMLIRAAQSREATPSPAIAEQNVVALPSAGGDR